MDLFKIGIEIIQKGLYMKKGRCFFIIFIYPQLSKSVFIIFFFGLGFQNLPLAAQNNALSPLLDKKSTAIPLSSCIKII